MVSEDDLAPQLFILVGRIVPDRTDLQRLDALVAGVGGKRLGHVDLLQGDMLATDGDAHAKHTSIGELVTAHD